MNFAATSAIAARKFSFFDHCRSLYLFVSMLFLAQNAPVFFPTRARNTVNLRIQSHDLVLTDGLRQHVATRLASALHHGQKVVRQVVVRLADILPLTRGNSRRAA
jgi:hypothetical protein